MDSDERALEVMKTKLDVLLAEYASVREEKVGRIQLQTTLSQAMLTGLVAVYGAMIQTDRWQAIPLFGFFSAMVALFWGERQRVIQLLRDYIREELESERLEQILGPDYPTDPLLGWQTHFHSKWHKPSATIYFTLYTLLLGVGVVPALIFEYFVWRGIPASHPDSGIGSALAFWQRSEVGVMVCVVLGVLTVIFSVAAVWVSLYYRLKLMPKPEP